jgi:hypothetical protein
VVAEVFFGAQPQSQPGHKDQVMAKRNKNGAAKPILNRFICEFKLDHKDKSNKPK